MPIVSAGGPGGDATCETVGFRLPSGKQLHWTLENQPFGSMMFICHIYIYTTFQTVISQAFHLWWWTDLADEDPCCALGNAVGRSRHPWAWATRRTQPAAPVGKSFRRSQARLALLGFETFSEVKTKKKVKQIESSRFRLRFFFRDRMENGWTCEVAGSQSKQTLTKWDRFLPGSC